MDKTAFLFAIFFPMIAASPFRELGNIGSPCLSKCIEPLANVSVEIDFKSTKDFGKQMTTLDKICNLMTEAGDCVEKCGVLPINPLKTRMMQAMCGEEQRKELKSHIECYESGQAEVMKTCNAACGNTSISSMMDKMNTSTATSMAEVKAEMGKMLENLKDICTESKCQARCNRDEFTRVCADPSAGAFLQDFMEDILEATTEDLEEFGMIEQMKSMLPEQCNFMLQPDLLFNDKVEGVETMIGKPFISSEESDEDSFLPFNTPKANSDEKEEALETEVELLKERMGQLQMEIQKLQQLVQNMMNDSAE